MSLAPKSCCPVSGFLLSLTVPLSVIAYLWRLGWNPPKPRNEVIQISGWGGEFWSNKLGTEILVLKTIVLAMKAPCGAYLIPYSVFYVSNIKTFLVTGPTPIITIISQTITEQGPWWWSSGQHARLLLWPSEFESRWRLQFFPKHLCFKKNENKQKEARVVPLKTNRETLLIFISYRQDLLAFWDRQFENGFELNRNIWVDGTRGVSQQKATAAHRLWIVMWNDGWGDHTCEQNLLCKHRVLTI